VTVRSSFSSSVGSLFDRARKYSSVSANSARGVARSSGLGRPLGQRASASPRKGTSTRARSISFGSTASLVVMILSLGCPARANAGSQFASSAAQLPSASRTEPFADFVKEASKRFAVPEHWIASVMGVESGNNPHAISSKGAIGLMQIMPDTWAELRDRYILGADPFDPHDNIFAGAAYLGEMHDRYGTIGFLAAYNAGPERYEEHLATGRPLPEETIAYVAALKPMLDVRSISGGSVSEKSATSWRGAPVFVVRGSRRSGDDEFASQVSAKTPSPTGISALAPHSRDLFIPH
jgi:transglycosylase-like protein with SLT domain